MFSTAALDSQSYALVPYSPKEKKEMEEKSASNIQKIYQAVERPLGLFIGTFSGSAIGENLVFNYLLKGSRPYRVVRNELAKSVVSLFCSYFQRDTDSFFRYGLMKEIAEKMKESAEPIIRRVAIQRSEEWERGLSHSERKKAIEEMLPSPSLEKQGGVISYLSSFIWTPASAVEKKLTAEESQVSLRYEKEIELILSMTTSLDREIETITEEVAKKVALIASEVFAFSAKQEIQLLLDYGSQAFCGMGTEWATSLLIGNLPATYKATIDSVNTATRLIPLTLYGSYLTADYFFSPEQYNPNPLLNRAFTYLSHETLLKNFILVTKNLVSNKLISRRKKLVVLYTKGEATPLLGEREETLHFFEGLQKSLGELSSNGRLHSEFQKLLAHYYGVL